jgi:hypothetical protein
VRQTIGALSLVTALTASGGACGGSSSTYAGLISCTQLENVESFGLLQACEEVEAGARMQLQQGCTAATTTDAGSPTVVNAPCSRVSTLGGCQITSGGFKETFWYYGVGGDAEVGATPGDIQRLCSGSGGAYFAP